jgi:hypothetical protein
LLITVCNPSALQGSIRKWLRHLGASERTLG